MNVNHIQALVEKDLNVFMRKKGILYAVVILPFAFSIGIPAILNYAITYRVKNPAAVATTIATLIPSFSYLFVILAGIAPIQISTYSLVGEKVEKSMEPLLATPLTDSEILLSKTIIAFFPTLITLTISETIFTIIIDAIIPNLGDNYLPNWTFLFIALIIVPLTLLLSIEIGIIVSSRVNDARSASQLGMVLLIPLFAVYLLSETNVITLDQTTLYEIAGILVVVNLILFITARLIFQREQILTKWK